MPRTVALRASTFFVLLAFAFGAMGIHSQSAIAEAFFLICASVCALTLLVPFASPAQAPVPARLRRTRR